MNKSKLEINPDTLYMLRKASFMTFRLVTCVELVLLNAN